MESTIADFCLIQNHFIVIFINKFRKKLAHDRSQKEVSCYFYFFEKLSILLFSAAYQKHQYDKLIDQTYHVSKLSS